ncbi:nucleotide-diphospho-sugar transferase [Aspergillus avenaceus]|uniref:Nucleotide-diphospho-sugar transferase n=1 Tax=Aspergillus avenaceus TaxID=36643 RepID=A0A5N6TZV3_ASPAV|nr:nucleotide-diphospho-sugar transferase [Aspergillus avenaceus]
MRLFRSPFRVPAILTLMAFALITHLQLGKNSLQGACVPLSHTSPNANWSRFAYAQYVTNIAYLCNSVMIFEALSRLGSKADRFMMYPSNYQVDSTSEAGRLLSLARDKYNVRLVPITVQRRNSDDELTGKATWAESYTELLVFNQTQYDRVLSLDSDATILQVSLDELFLLPPCPVAMPRAYWLDFNERILASNIMLLQPSEVEFSRIMQSIDSAGSSVYDMDIMNQIYRDSALILPHRPYNMLTAEFRFTNHTPYLGNPHEVWDPEKALVEAKYIHFSDWPVSKPWIKTPHSIMLEKQPVCNVELASGSEDCRDRDHWLGFYEDFARRRESICGEGFKRENA